MLLTDSKIRAAAPAAKTIKLLDGDGLHLEVTPQGSKRWRFRYRHDGKEKMLSLGLYPEVSLRQARDAREAARKRVASGVDPSAERKALKEAKFSSASQENSFEAVAREWHTTVFKLGVSEGHAARTLLRLEHDAFPWLGSLPISTITPPEVLKTVRRVESRGAIETAHRVKNAISQVMRYGISTGRCERDATADLRGALRPALVRHMPAITDPKRAGELMRAIDGYKGSFIVRCALQLAPLTFVRPGELRGAQWAEFNIEEAVWRIPGARMKRSVQGKQSGQDHLVPLSTQALGVLAELKPLTGHKPHLFPAERGERRTMSDATVGAALRRLGFSQNEMTGHGFRAMARTMLVERLGVEENIVEAQLAHAVQDSLGRAYNRTQFVDQRRQMMQQWADYLDRLRVGAEVVQIRA